MVRLIGTIKTLGEPIKAEVRSSAVGKGRRERKRMGNKEVSLLESVKRRESRVLII